jgi:hypothetical protein
MNQIPHEEFRQTPTYAALCADFSLDPAIDLAKQLIPVTWARGFWKAYDQARWSLTPWTGAHVARRLEVLIRAQAGASGALDLVERYGHLVVVMTEDGQSWALTAEPADPAVVGQAMAQAKAAETPLS